MAAPTIHELYAQAAQTRPSAAGYGSANAPQSKSQPGRHWTKKTSDMLQEAVDRAFGGNPLGMEFSFTIADPFLEDCPLIGCSTGFTKLTGYGLEDIVGRNCRFLVEPVPMEHRDADARRICRDFCMAVKDGVDYTVPWCDRKPWMRTDKERPGDELMTVQKNARKDGSLFNNFFYMKAFELGAEVGEGRPFIVGLQSELIGGTKALMQVAKNLEQLEVRMDKVKTELAAMFYMECSMSRQKTPERLLPEEFAGMSVLNLLMSKEKNCKEQVDEKPMRRCTSATTEGNSEQVQAPSQLSSAFAPDQVEPWKEGRLQTVKQLCEAPRNKGRVLLMLDQANNQFLAVKQMPNEWLQTCHEKFVETHPTESELPWQDIGCTRFLNSIGFQYACTLEGVYRGDEDSFVASTFASEGDLFDTALSGMAPGLEREAKYAKIVFQLFDAMEQLHSMQIVHRDMSLENVLLTKKDGKDLEVKIIDYAMASTKGTFLTGICGKQSYQAPEMYTQTSHDPFFAETFSVGVLLYALFAKDYPWMSTKPGVCKHFGYFEANGFRELITKRKVRKSTDRIIDVLSESLKQLLEGMLTLDPNKRLSLGELEGRRSVWDEPWMKQLKYPKSDAQVVSL